MLAAILASQLAFSGPWTLATDDTVARVAIREDRPVVESLRARDDDHEWCRGSEIRLIGRVWTKQREIQIAWHYTRGDQRGSVLTLRFRSERPEMELRSIWRARKGRGPIEHWVEIENLTKESITVPQQESLDLDGLDAGGDAQVWWSRRGATNALTQGGVFRDDVKPGLDLNLVSDHHDGASPVPWLAVQAGEKRGLYLGWEFSGRGRLSALVKEPPPPTPSSRQNHVARGGGLLLAAGLMPDFNTDVRPGETLKIPAAFAGCYKGDIDDGSYSLHRFIMEKLRANPPATFADPTMVCGIYLDAGADHATESTLLPTVGFAKDIGFDTFMPDAMWFPACGDWRWDPARFPHGSNPIHDAVVRGRMHFGLWCAWDNGGVSTDPGALSVRGPAGHPDWFGSNLPANWQPGPFYGASACMASPEAKAWAIKKTQSMANEIGFDYLKTDVHPMISDCIRTDHRHSHGTDVSYWSALGVYDVWDALRRTHPNMVLENCSGASHIKDFGVIQRCAYTATTDTLSNLPDRAGIWDSTFYLPPAALMTYTYERGYGLPGDDPGSYLFRSAMMTGWDLAPTNSKGWTDEEKAAGRAATKTYREWIRPILRDCRVYHVLPRPDGKHWDGMFLWSEKLRNGTLFVFRPDSDVGGTYVKLRGLVPEREYVVWSEGGHGPDLVRGGMLMEKGIRVSLSNPYSSDLFHIQESRLPKPGAWSIPGKFKLLAPVIEGDPSGVSATLSWTRSPGATSYRVVGEVAERYFERIVYEPRFRLDDVVPGQHVHWGVQAIGWGPVDSPNASFRVPESKPWPGVFVSDLPFVRAEAGSDRVHRDENYAGKRLSIAGKV